jgi:hypothetical protein
MGVSEDVGSRGNLRGRVGDAPVERAGLTTLLDEEHSVLERVVHPITDHVRPTGLAAMVGGVLGICVAPLYSLAYFATDEVAPSEDPGRAESARDLAEPLLTFASADAVYLTYGKLFLFVWASMLAGLVALHATQAWRATGSSVGGSA